MIAVALIYLLHRAGEPPLRQYVGTLISGAGHAPQASHVDLLIRWGNTEGDDSGARHVLNRRGPLADSQNRARANLMLARAGIHVHHVPPGERLRVRELFRVHALDFRLVYLGRRERSRYGFQELAPDHSPLAEKATRYACRALYALGLDFGSVDVVVSGGRLAILKVDPQPLIDGRLADRYAAALEDYLSETGLALFPDIRLGADPEFMIRRDTGQMIPASRFFPTDGEIGCDAVARRTARGALVRPLAELRPPASSSPDQLVRSIQRLIARAAARVPYSNVQFRAGSQPFAGLPIGGHIHFSGLGQANGAILRALDTYLTIPLFLIENTAVSRMRRPRYGFLGDQRPQRWGFEYRTPASWLVSPRIARAALSLAKVVATHHRQLRRDVFSDPEMAAHFYAGDKEPFYGLAGRLFEELTQLGTYGEYADAIAPLRQMIAQRRQWNEFVDIRRTWRVPVAARLYPSG